MTTEGNQVSQPDETVDLVPIALHDDKEVGTLVKHGHLHQPVEPGSTDMEIYAIHCVNTQHTSGICT